MNSEKQKTGWLTRLRSGLQRSSSKISDGIETIFKKQKLDDAALEELEELLISSDIGPATASRLVEDFGKTRFGKDVTDQEVKLALATAVSAILAPCAKPLTIDKAHKPFVVLVVGVNGTGKTTTIGKLAQYYRSEGLNVMLAAGDTFRAAAISQLQIWGERTGCKVITDGEGGDAAALAYKALQSAKEENADLLLIDTAGRLHNKTDLMNELSKVIRVIKKLDADAPHATLLVLDATTGQNAHSQVETFRELTQITGLVVTKLDGSAKGGVLVALADRFHLPIHAIGVGEDASDLRPFDAKEFSESLMGLT